MAAEKISFAKFLRYIFLSRQNSAPVNEAIKQIESEIQSIIVFPDLSKWHKTNRFV